MTLTSVASVTEARRQERYTARHTLWDHSTLKRVRHCGRVVRSKTGVAVKVTESPAGRSAGFSGLATCGSVWACPVCSAKIAAGRQTEIERALGAWHARGGRVGLVTLTMRHHRGQTLQDLWDGVSDAWHAASSGRGWQVDQETYGSPITRRINSGKRKGELVEAMRIPTIRVVEVTHGQSGWHVHIHALLLFGASASIAQVVNVGASMFDRWSRSLVGGGFDAPLFQHGVDARRLEGDPAAALGEYFTKAQYSASYELARGDLKDARGGNRTPFGILRGLVEVRTTGDLGDMTIGDLGRDEGLWREWESASKGRRQVAWTPGLRALLLPNDEELSDEELAEADHGGDVVATITAPTWAEIARARADCRILAAFNLSTLDGLAALLPYELEAKRREAERFAGIDRMQMPRAGYRG